MKNPEGFFFDLFSNLDDESIMVHHDEDYNKSFKVIELERTCEMFPDQYEGILEDGRMIYIRLRHGYITAAISPGPTTDIDDAVNGITMFEIDLCHDIVNRTQLKQIFKEAELDVDWSGCDWIDPFRFPPMYTRTMLGHTSNWLYWEYRKVRSKINCLMNDIKRSSAPINKKGARVFCYDHNFSSFYGTTTITIKRG